MLMEIVLTVHKDALDVMHPLIHVLLANLVISSQEINVLLPVHQTHSEMLTMDAKNAIHHVKLAHLLPSVHHVLTHDLNLLTESAIHVFIHVLLVQFMINVTVV
jgi:hypothetical protein